MAVLRRVLAAWVSAIALPGPIPSAWAHAVLIDSSPAVNAAVDPGPLAISLHYNSRIDAARSIVTLSAADHARTRIAMQTGDTPDTLRGQTVPLDAGAYVLRWQVLAIDGHITRGEVPFGVRPSAP